MITKSKIKKGIEDGVVIFKVDPAMKKGTICQIGRSWFYFGDETAEEMNPDEYLKNVPIDDIIDEILIVLDDFRQSKIFDSKSEYDYYDAILSSNEDQTIKCELVRLATSKLNSLKDYLYGKPERSDDPYTNGAVDGEYDAWIAVLDALGIYHSYQTQVI